MVRKLTPEQANSKGFFNPIKRFKVSLVNLSYHSGTQCFRWLALTQSFVAINKSNIGTANPSKTEPSGKLV